MVVSTPLYGGLNMTDEKNSTEIKETEPKKREMIDTDKYEGLNEVINRIINSDEIGIDDLLADSMAVKKGINELLAEVKRLREKLFEAELWVNNDSYTFENDIKELNDFGDNMPSYGDMSDSIIQAPVDSKYDANESRIRYFVKES